MSDLAVYVLHIVVKPYKAPFIRRSLEEARDDGVAWHGFKLMERVDVKEIANGVFAQSFNSSGSIEELANNPNVVRVGVFNGLCMNQVIQAPAQERERRETIIFDRQAVAA